MLYLKNNLWRCSSTPFDGRGFTGSPSRKKSAFGELKILDYESLIPEPGINSSLLFENEVLLAKPGPIKTVIEIH